MSSLLIKNITIFENGEAADILCSGGLIADVASSIPESAADEVFDGTGLYAVPGLVDLHVHLRDPGQTQKEDILSGCAAAAAGGVTSLAAMPNTSPPADSPETIRYIKEKAAGASAKVYPVGAISKGLAGRELCEMDKLAEAGAAAFSDDGCPVVNSKIMLSALAGAARLELPVLSHSEDPCLSEGGVMNEGKTSRSLGLQGNPAIAEEMGILRDIALSASRGYPVHICHVSTKGAVEIIREAKRRGVNITCETAPHYFTLTDENLKSCNPNYKMNPPLRSREDLEGIIEGIKDGTIDVIATDHAPHAPWDKEDLLTAANGIIGMQTLLPLTYTYLVLPGYITPRRMVEMVSRTPAELLNIQAGQLKTGVAADIALFDPRSFILNKSMLAGKSTNCPFINTEMNGRVRLTVLDGKIVYKSELE